jgi:hypothetical protein
MNVTNEVTLVANGCGFRTEIQEKFFGTEVGTNWRQPVSSDRF